MKKTRSFTAVMMLLLGIMLNVSVKASEPAAQGEIKHVLVIGDSMTGWLSERLNAYGEKNGFDVSTVLWDGSTIKKWATSPKLKSTIDKYNPDAVIVCLGMNELFEANPEKNVGPYLDKVLAAIGDRPYLWVGPPSWPGKGAGKGMVLNDWFEKRLGEGNFFRSFDLKIPRQSASNPHPTRPGSIFWMDKVVEWIPDNSNLNLKTANKPASGAMNRGKNFVYRKMKETL